MLSMLFVRLFGRYLRICHYRSRRAGLHHKRCFRHVERGNGSVYHRDLTPTRGLVLLGVTLEH